MQMHTPEFAAHLLKHLLQYSTPIGSFLRKTSLDELSQFWINMKEDNSFVGPLPALFYQHNLISLRTQSACA